MRIQTWSEETEEVVGAGAGDQGSLGLSETREREREAILSHTGP